MNYVIAGCILALLFFGGCSDREASRDEFNIVLVTIDTLRADHLSCYGYERKTSPNIDSIAEKGILFKNVIAPSSWTAPSMVSLFTSVYPINHKVVHGIAPRWNPRKQEIFSEKLSTMTEIVKAHGYTTFGVAANFHLSEQFGFARGFDFFQCIPSQPAPAVNESVYSWENEIKKADKFFLWVHYFDPHVPYKLRTAWSGRNNTEDLKQQEDLSKKSFPQLKKLIPFLKTDPQAFPNLVALYDSEINFVDSHLGELFEKFQLDENTLIIITSDHGEEFLEHGQLGHGHTLHQETINIPLIVKLPHSSEKRVVEQPFVNLIDVMPSILHMLNIDPPEQVLGESILETGGLLLWLKSSLLGNNKGGYNYSELDVEDSLKTIITPEWKYIYNNDNNSEQLYNIKSDPSELNNLADKERYQRSFLREKLFTWIKNSKEYPPSKKSFVLTEEDEKKLEALGYLTAQANSNKKQDSDLDEGDYHWFEAENVETISNPLVVVDGPAASGGKYICALNGAGNQYTPGPVMATYTVNISRPGVYIVWGRVRAPDGRDNSFFVQVDDGADHLWEVEPADRWHWDKVNDRNYLADPVEFTLASGKHTIKIKLREDGTELDALLLTNRINFIPQ